MPLKPYPITQQRGIISQHNPVSLAPEGSLIEAENCVMDREGIISKRRGFAKWAALGTTAPFDTDKYHSMSEYLSNLIIHDGTTLKYMSTAGSVTSWSGTVDVPANASRIRYGRDRLNLYLTTDLGIYRTDALANDPVLAGMPGGLDMELSHTNLGAGWWATDSQIAYKIVWGRTDNNGRELLGEPSQRERLTNTSGGTTNNVEVIFTVPDSIVNGDFYEIYRTEPSATDATDPGDTFYRAKRVVVTGSPTAGSTITFTDASHETDDELYTNETQEGVSRANARPPYAEDLALFKGHMYYANTRREHVIEVRLLDASNLVVDDTFIVTQSSAHTYTVKATELIGSNHFAQDTVSSTEAEKIRNTAKSLVRVINRDTGNTEVWAHYLDTEDEDPGKIVIRSRGFSETEIELTSTGTVMDEQWLPEVPTSSGPTSDNSSRPNGIHRAKFEQPDSVPYLVGGQVIGSEEYEVLRILPLNDSLMIFHERGVWRITGEDEDTFTRPKELDASTWLWGPDTAVVLNDAVYCLSNQGVVKADENGTAIVSRQIENQLKETFTLAEFKESAFSVAYESEKRLVIATKTTDDDVLPTKAWVYNHLLKAWTTWNIEAACGYTLFADDKMYFGAGSSGGPGNFVMQERKTANLRAEDFRDEAYSVSNVVVGTTTNGEGDTVSTVTFDYPANAVNGWGSRDIRDGGWYIDCGGDSNGQGTHTWSPIVNLTKVSTSGGDDKWTVELDQDFGLTGTPSTHVSVPIVSRIRWAPIHLGDPASMKVFARVVIHFLDSYAEHHRMLFSSDLLQGEEWLDFKYRAMGFGMDLWGEGGWGDGEPRPAMQPGSVVPRLYQRCHALNVAYVNEWAAESFEIASLTAHARVFQPRNLRTTV